MGPSEKMSRPLPAVAVVITCLLALAGAAVHAPQATAGPAYAVPDPDAFYHDATGLADAEPGEVLRFREIDAAVYSGARGWQVAFRSTNSHGAPIVGVTTVFIPPAPAPQGAARPMLSYQPIVNALGARCAPSRALFNLEQVEAPGLLLPLQRGWAVNIPDHLGPGNAYGAARLGGMITLDSIRAVRSLPQLGLESSPVGLAGYSGGAMSTAWAAALQPEYAPELELVGAVQGGLPADLEQMAEVIGDEPHPGFGLGFAAAIGLEREYPERFRMSPELNPEGQRLRDFMSNECRRSILFHGAFRGAAQLTRSQGWLRNSEAREVLRENSIRYFDGVPSIPVYMWHGKLDPLTPYDGVAEIAQRYCASGSPLTFVTYDVAEHLIPAALGFNDAYDYLADRFRGIPARSTC